MLIPVASMSTVPVPFAEELSEGTRRLAAGVMMRDRASLARAITLGA